MRKGALSVVIAAVLTIVSGVFATEVAAAPADDYTTTHFGAGNVPPGCEEDTWDDRMNFQCHHMRTDMNGLDSPQIDVLVAVPASPTAERDLRIMRQAIDMWDGGIEYLAPQMGLDWLSDGVDFHISAHILDPAGGGGEFSTYPIVDPEIVVLATNPVGAAGIGVDPVHTYLGAANEITEIATGTNPGLPTDEPCHGVSNPLDVEYWESLPGFDSHHDGRSGTYTEDCEGAGGNICFAINTGLDPAPDVAELGSLFDLVAHEFGHCLSVGHVGDGAEGAWGALPPNDIMAYSTEPAGLNKCVSTLNVEGLATRMSRYLDADGNGVVSAADKLDANDPVGDGLDPFQVQHPRDHLYASRTGAPRDCPQPDLSVVPGSRTDWTPNASPTNAYAMTVTGPSDGATSSDGAFDVTGTVEKVSAVDPPTDVQGFFDDSDADAKTGFTEIKHFAVEVTPTHVNATISLKNLPPITSKTLTSPSVYSVEIDGRRFDSFVRYPVVDPGPMTWDATAAAYLPAGTSGWGTGGKYVAFKIPRSYLDGVGVTAPYAIASNTSVGNVAAQIVDDRAPERGNFIGVAGAKGPAITRPGMAFSPRQAMSTVTFEHEGGNTFFPEQSTAGATTAAGIDASHVYGLDLDVPSDIEFTLDWTDNLGGSDLDLRVSGAADSGTAGASSSRPETVLLTGVQGHIDITVEPYLVTDPADGATYTLTAVIAEGDVVDTDGDGVFDPDDACPNLAGNGADGCPVAALERVLVFVDGLQVAAQDVDTATGADSFSIPVTVAAGDHTLRIEWEYYGAVRATATRQVTRPPA